MFVRTVSLIAVLGVLTAPSFARIREVPFEARTDAATLIVEGRVIESRPELDPATAMIHTTHVIETSRILKARGWSDSGLRRVDIVTPGGKIGESWHRVVPSLELKPGDVGLFFLEPAAGRTTTWAPFASVQGFVVYHPGGPNGAASDPFRTYQDVETDLIGPIVDRVGESVRTFGAIEGLSDPPATTLGNPVITALTPSTRRAGVRELLTIEGTGFGTRTGQATVFFDDADDGPGGNFGGVDPLYIQSWTDTQIEVWVPRSSVTAGTGSVIVRDFEGSDAFSPGPLTVPYALGEVVSGDVYRVRLEDENGQGGLTYRYSTASANGGVDFTSVPDAQARFEEALEAWRCSGGYNAEVSGTTAIAATGNDGVNIVAFDNDADPLPAGVLGRATSFYSSCGGDTWYVNGVDIRFRRDGSGGTTWYYGADAAGQGAGETDFYSVALHEQGHAVQHGHVNDSSDVMYYALTTGTNKRALSASDLDGADDILTFSSGFASCGTTGMTAFDCSLAPIADFVGDPLGACGTSVAVDFTDQSLNGPTSWNWDFGDGGVSAETDPTHTYTAQGVYDVRLDVSNANGSDARIRADYIVLTDDPAPATCSPTFAGHDNCCGIGIRNVTLNTIDRTTGTPTDGDPLEEDFTCSAITVLEAETGYAISVTTGSANDEDVRVYVDWNGDGTLAAGELAFSSDDARTHAGTITPPAGALRDTALRMRVLSDFAPVGIVDACENIEYGQVENYSVVVVDAANEPGVVPDTSLRLARGSVSGSIDLSWDISCGGGAADYTVHEGTLGSWYSHTAKECTTGGATSFEGLVPEAGDRYFLVVPVSTAAEGSYGVDSTAAERPVSTTTCLPAQDTTACP